MLNQSTKNHGCIKFTLRPEDALKRINKVFKALIRDRSYT